jgi:serine/threonine protein kinase
MSAHRIDRFFEWNEGDTAAGGEATASTAAEGERVLVGSGKYGKVFREPNGVVVKEVSARVTGRGLAPPFREKIVSIFQSLLVVNRVSPNFPLHYGCNVCPPLRGGGRLGMHFYIEEFDGSLDKLAGKVLVSSAAWLTSLFQILSAVLTFAATLSICHNDLYPRNVLVKRLSSPQKFTYVIYGRTYTIEVEFVLAVTDFGICSSPLLGSPSGDAPEVAAKLKGEPRDCAGAPFGSVPPRKHILHYKFLPPFARDVYLVLKWTVFPTKNFPLAPACVSAWARRALAYIDENEKAFFKTDASKELFAFAFSAQELGLSGLPSLCGATEGTEGTEGTEVAGGGGGAIVNETFRLGDSTREETIKAAAPIVHALAY